MSSLLLFNCERIKIIIDIFIAILFAFGLKFVFTNIGDWEQFMYINIINVILNIFINGSFQSHNYGKNIINKLKSYLNKWLPESNQLNILDFDDIEQVLKYNRELAFGLSIKFLISSCSSLIIMTYFAMSMVTFNMSIDNKVYQFMAASFGVDCIVFLGQIFVFKKRDRKYFVMTVKVIVPESSWAEFITVSLFLAWFWIGNLTGCPADFQSS